MPPSKQIIESLTSGGDCRIELVANAARWPAGWRGLRRELCFEGASRSDDDYPIWFIRRLSGAALWMSDVKLADSSASPPEWRIRIECASQQSSAVVAELEQLILSIERFLDECGIGHRFDRL